MLPILLTGFSLTYVSIDNIFNGPFRNFLKNYISLNEFGSNIREEVLYYLILLVGKSNKEIEEFFIERNSRSFEEWLVSNHGEYMKTFSENIITKLGENLSELGIVSIDSRYDRLFNLEKNETEKLMIISHAGTMSVLISYFLNVPLYPWTWRQFLPRHAGHTILKSTKISSGHFFRLKEFNNVSFMDGDELKTY